MYAGLPQSMPNADQYRPKYWHWSRIPLNAVLCWSIPINAGSIILDPALIRIDQQLKVDRPPPCIYTHTPTDHRHTDKPLRPVRSKVKRLRQERSDKLTNGRTDGRTDAAKYIISLASRSIMIGIDRHGAMIQGVLCMTPPCWMYKI